MWRIFTRLCTKDKLFTVLDYPRNFGKQPKKAWRGQPIGRRTVLQIQILGTCHDPVGRTRNSTVTTWANGTTEHTEDEGLGVSVCCRSASALFRTGNNDGKSWNIPVEPQSDRNSTRRTGKSRTLWLRGVARKQRKQDEEEDGILEYDSPSDDGDIPSLEQEADFHLGRGSRFGRSIRFNSRIVFSKLLFISLVMEL